MFGAELWRKCWAFALLFQISEGFVHYSLISDVATERWRADQLCKDRGYAGLAITDTPQKWDFAKGLLQWEQITSEVWLGLEYDGLHAAPLWEGDKPATWEGDWDTDQPDWGYASCVVVTPSTLKWTTFGCNFMRHTLCESYFDNLKVQYYPSMSLYFDASSTLHSTSTISLTECGMTCASFAACSFLSYDDASTDCVIYDARYTLSNTPNPAFATARLYNVARH